MHVLFSLHILSTGFVLHFFLIIFKLYCGFRLTLRFSFLSCIRFFICLRLRLLSNVFCVSGLFLRVPRTFIYIYRSPPLSLIRTEQVDETIGICLTDV
jgi:hypothetical protein